MTFYHNMVFFPYIWTGLLCGASHFELDDLVRACWDFIDHCSRNNSICLMIPAARRYSQHTTGKMIISWVRLSIYTQLRTYMYSIISFDA